jgi:2-polyprenyl-3-methyl-5-hydroxy-6-metoxy-1,4-benzoquinol methylase
MKFTGERMIPEYNLRSKIYLEHVNRYYFSSQFVRNKDVLDIACGSGYGARILFDSGANSVLGVDISEESIGYCRNKYPNIDFSVGSVDNIPCKDKSFDTIVSFETLEHVDTKKQERFMQEINRVLRDDGVFILSTPNALVYEKGNEFHVKELTPEELDALLKKYGFEFEILFQESVDANYIFSSNEISEGKVNKGFFRFENDEGRRPWEDRYLIVVCVKKDNKSPVIDSSVYISNIQSIRHGINQDFVSKQIEEKEKELEEKNREILLIKSSKFWKLREIYLKTKHWLIFIFLNPRKFIKKYLNI